MSTGTARLWPVCPASHVNYCNYKGSARKDAENRVTCPVCLKVVKLRKAAGESWPNTIPHHHAQPNEANLARIRKNNA